MRIAFVLALTALSLAACNTYADGLARSRDAFEQNQHERALAILRSLEPDENHLSTNDQAEYAYLRGMTDYRIGYLKDARHWLSVAREIDRESPKALNDDWKQRLAQVLDELNKQVYENGFDSLGNAGNANPKTDEGDDANGARGNAKKGDPSGKKKPLPKPEDESIAP